MGRKVLLGIFAGQLLVTAFLVFDIIMILTDDDDDEGGGGGPLPDPDPTPWPPNTPYYFDRDQNYWDQLYGETPHFMWLGQETVMS